MQWNRTLRELAAARGLSELGAARMLAMVHVSAADALIGCWDAKYHYLFWRPIHAIQRADNDGNDQTEQDITWTAPLTVNHPEYPSGHACATGAVTFALARYFGTDEIAFSMSSTVTGTTRTYETFSASLAEVVNARIWPGLHFQFSMEDGTQIGYDAAHLVTSTRFRPTG